MNRRPTAEIVADLRDPKQRWAEQDDSDDEHPDGIETLQEFRNRVEREAADRLTELDALLPDCPVCRGTGIAEQQVADRTYVALYGGPCPDCDHGKVRVAQMATLWRAVHEFEFRELQWGDEYDAGAQAAIEQVREAAKTVRP